MYICIYSNIFVYIVGLRPLHKRMYVRKVKNSFTIITRV